MRFTEINILYVGNEDKATTKQRLMALREMQINFDVVYTYLLDQKISVIKRIYRAISFRLGYFPERNNENKQILERLTGKKYDILFIEKGLSIKASTIIAAKKLYPFLKIVSYSLDDVMNRNNSSVYFRRSIPLYDFLFTNKKYNVEELKMMGAKNVFYFRNAFSPQVHRPVHVTEEEKEFFGCEVAFIGTFEDERAAYIKFLANNGIKIKIWGWSKTAETSGMQHSNIQIMQQHVYDDEYAKVVCSSKINLCFLRKENRDKETTRSIEIPACGGFMIAERTNEHRELFKEDEEAVFFNSKNELLQKIKHYLLNHNERVMIAKCGLARCLNSNYSYQKQLSDIFSTVMEHETFSNN
jgi:spore maturation protein CgeB